LVATTKESAYNATLQRKDGRMHLLSEGQERHLRGCIAHPP
jgi:hypothetical protein